MIMHILCMYNYKNPRTWDASLHYVKHSCNIHLHSSMGQNTFQVGLGFQPLCLINVAMPHVITQEESTHVQYEVDKATNFIEHIQYIGQ